MEKNLRFSSTLTQVKKINPLFSIGKAYILYEGINRNNSYISTEAITNAIPTLYNIPIVGEYIEDKDNFGGHGGKLEITDTEIKYKITTKPYGVIPESAEVYWEDVTEADGTNRRYLVVDGIYLWSGRYEELDTLLENKKFGQSMEIQVENGNFAVIDGQETFKIDEFIFSALCILGIDKGNNPDDHVEPAFESASISVYELDKDSFKHEFNQMIAELKFSLQLQEGGKSVEDVKQEFEEQVTETTETEQVETVDEQVEDVTAETVVVEDTFEQVETVESTEEESEVEVVEEVIEETFTREFVDTLNSQIETLSSEVQSLKAYKRQREEQDLRDKFAHQVSDEEFKQLFNEEITLDEIETKIYALIGKKNFSLSEEKPSNKIAIKVDKDVKKDNPYADFFN